MADIFSRPIQIDAELSPQGTLSAELTPNETLDGELSIPRQVEVIGNYETLRNKPSINDVELTGNKTSSELGLANATHTHTKSDITDFTHTHTTDEITDFPTLAEVATSGDYDDLSNKPNLSEVATSGDYGDLSNRPNIPANTSDLTNNSGFISQETDPTVPSWAKQETKPTYTAQEVGALPDDTVIPSKTSDLTNDEGFISSPNVVYCTCATGKGTAAKVATIISGALTTLNVGDQAIVKFTSSNTSASPTLKIGNTDAKPIMRYGTTTPSASADTSWNAGSPILFVYDGTYWVMCGFLNSVYYEISVANITNGSSSSAGLTSGRRAKSAVEAFAPVKDVKIDGTSVVSGGIAQIPKIPELVTDLGVIDGDLYDWDIEEYLNTLQESGAYIFLWDEFRYWVDIEALEVDGTTTVEQIYWGTEEGSGSTYYRNLLIEDGEIVDQQTITYLTFQEANSAFSRNTHVHYRTDAKAVSVWDFCNTVALWNANPIVIYFDLSTNKTYLIETYVGTRQPVYKMQKVTEMNDTSYFCQRSSYYYSGAEHWGNWYKFTGTIFDPSGR